MTSAQLQLLRHMITQMIHENAHPLHLHETDNNSIVTFFILEKSFAEPEFRFDKVKVPPMYTPPTTLFASETDKVFAPV